MMSTKLMYGLYFKYQGPGGWTSVNQEITGENQQKVWLKLAVEIKLKVGSR